MCGRGTVCQREAHGDGAPGWRKGNGKQRSERRKETRKCRLRAPGMRAPRNTNQFLMREKYRMMHMRSDSVGTDSGSDCDTADMDSYLGVLENARGALLDAPPPPASCARRGHPTFPFFDFDREESMQYFPSDDDVIQSEDFMRRDFVAFCDAMPQCA